MTSDSGVGDRRPSAATLIDVARAAGVSRATAARAMGNYGSVKPETAEAVHSAARALGYEPNVLARSMITGRSRTIGVVLADIENNFFIRALRGIEHAARLHGFDVLLANSDESVESERISLEGMRGRRVEGLLLCPADTDDVDHLRALVEGDHHVVLLDRDVAGLAVDSVGIDNRAAGRMATEYLIRAGHTDIALLSGLRPSLFRRAMQASLETPRPGESPTEGRMVGYRAALTDAGLPVNPALMPAHGGSHFEEARIEMAKLLESGARPTAVLTSDSVQTLGVIAAVREAGLRLPSDISLLGFDDTDWAPVVDPSVTVIEQPAYEIGLQATDLLISRIQGRTEPASQVRLPTTIIERASVATLKRAAVSPSIPASV